LQRPCFGRITLPHLLLIVCCSFKEQLYQLSKLIEELEAGRKQKNDQIAQLKADVHALKLEQASQAGLAAQVKDLDLAKERVGELEGLLKAKEQELAKQREEEERLRKVSETHLASVQRLEFTLKSAEMDNEDLLAKMDG